MYGEETPTGKVQYIKNVYEEMRLRWQVKHASMVKAYDYVYGEQLTPEQRKILTSKRRPAIVFNFIQAKVVTIAGMVESNMPFVRAVPFTEGDEKGAELHTKLVSDWAMKGCNAQTEYTKAALDAAIGGYGVLNNYYTFRGDPEGRWITEASDPFMFMFDTEARKKDQTDWRYYTYSAFYSAEEILATLSDSLTPEMMERIIEADERISGLRSKGRKTPLSWAQRIWAGVSDIVDRVRGRHTEPSNDYGVLSDFVDVATGTYRVIEFHDVRQSMTSILYNPQTQEKRPVPPAADGETPQAYAARMEQQAGMLTMATGQQWLYMRYPKEEKWKTVVCPYLLPDEVILEKPYKVQDAGWQHKLVMCYDFHRDATKMNSLIDVLIDPQDSYNQRRMTMLEYIMDIVRPDIHAPINSIDSTTINDWKSDERGKLLFYNPRMNQKPEKQHPPAEGAALLAKFAEEDRSLSETLTNITPNTQGLAENTNESGILFARRVQQSLSALSYFMGNLRLTMALCFTYCDRSLQRHMKFQRKVRLLTDGTPEWLQVNMRTLEGVHNDITQGQYDFIVDTKQLGETSKQIKFAEAMEFVGVIAQYFPEGIDWPKLFELWDSPVSEEMGEFAKYMMMLRLSNMGIDMKAMGQQRQIEQVAGAAGAVGQMDALTQMDDPMMAGGTLKM